MAPARAAARLMSSLPEEIQVEILLKLPAKSLLTCKCVCKPWLNLITSPRFINDHLHLSIQNKSNYKLMYTDTESDNGKPLIYTIDHNSISSTPDLSCDHIGDEAVLMNTPFEYKKGMEFRILGACHGLFCLGIFYDEESSICIWNPTTREYKEMQHCDFQIKPKRIIIAGFGYDSKTGDYKMVRIVEYFETSDDCEVEVYTFGSHLSKTDLTFSYKFPTQVLFGGVFVNGALHWINHTTEQDISDCIVSFDISNEELFDVPLPERSLIHPEDSNTRLFKKLGVLQDCLSLVLVDKKLVRAEVWMMQEYGVRESWTKLFTTTKSPITSRNILWTPVLSLKNGEILMYTYDGFVLCDPKNERVGKVSSFFQENSCFVRGMTMVTTHPESYIESLVSLKSGNYVQKPMGHKSRDVE